MPIFDTSVIISFQLQMVPMCGFKDIHNSLIHIRAMCLNTLESLIKQDGRRAAILNIKNLFDVHKPQTIPDLGVKFQTI